MSARHVFVELVTLSVLCAPSLAEGAVTAWTAVAVRVYDVNAVLVGTNATALDDARMTLHAAAVDVVWRMCKSPRACEGALAPGELALRIVRSPGPRRYEGVLPLGDAMIDTGGGGGVLATVYSDRVEWLAREARADGRTLLGRAIAHELGHLLMATVSHGPVGLMRALWSQDEVRRGRARDWSFAPSELIAIRRRVERRSCPPEGGRYDC
jgi:hypothetical protein